MDIFNKNNLIDIRYSAQKAIIDAEETGGTKPFFLDAYNNLALAADYLLLLIERSERDNNKTLIKSLREECINAPIDVCKTVLEKFDFDYPKTLEYMKNNPHLWQFNGTMI